MLADAVVVVHLGFVAFVVLGGFLLRRYPRLLLLHVPAAIWGALIEFAGWVCPLTPLENEFRRRGGEAGYEGGFVDHYLVPILYPGTLSRGVQVALGLFVIAINVLAYTLFFRQKHARR